MSDERSDNVFQLVSVWCDGCDREASECSGQEGHCNICRSMELRKGIYHNGTEQYLRLVCDDCGWQCGFYDDPCNPGGCGVGLQV